jgi:cytidylate kinase
MTEHYSEAEIAERLPAVRKVEIPRDELVTPDNVAEIRRQGFIWVGRNLPGFIEIEGERATIALHGRDTWLADHMLAHQEVRFGYPATQAFEGFGDEFHPEHTIHIDRSGVAIYIEQRMPEYTEVPKWKHRPSVITIEGLAATGKDTTAGLLCEYYGYRFHSVSAVGRGIAVGCLLAELPREDKQAISEFARTTPISIDTVGMHMQVQVDGTDVTERLFAEETSDMSSYLLRYEAVRDRARDVSLEEVRRGNVVVGGRYVASEAAPGAELQLFFTASEAERVRRRFHERSQAEPDLTEEEVARHIRDRDANEIKAGGATASRPAIMIDTTTLTPAGTVAAIVEAHNQRFHR